MISIDQAKALLSLIEHVHNWRDDSISRLCAQAQLMKENPWASIPHPIVHELALEEAFTQVTILRTQFALVDNITSPPDNNCKNCVSYMDMATGHRHVVCPTCKAIASVY